MKSSARTRTSVRAGLTSLYSLRIYPMWLLTVVRWSTAMRSCSSAKTYPTQGLVKLLSAIASRLSGKGGGEAVIQIQTPLGGGKTHSLIALYHLFKNPQAESAAELISKVRERAGLDAIPTARVVTFVGTAADPLGKTPWGALAEQLGNYALLADHDHKRLAPGKDLLHKLLDGAPTLLLMDEVAEYAARVKEFREQVIAFFQELTETVKVLPQCALVVTLPSSAPYGEEGQRALYQLQQVFGRVEAIYTPVEGEEIYEIIRRRLFEGTPDPSEVRKVADSYWEMYRRLGDDVPREVRETAYRDKLRKAYPFHPEMIDLLFERWSTYSSFQRTRGVLRFLAEVVADLYNTRQHSVPLIQPAHINLANPRIREELLKHIGNEYTGVIAADIADGNAKAQTIDREMAPNMPALGLPADWRLPSFLGPSAGVRGGDWAFSACVLRCCAKASRQPWSAMRFAGLRRSSGIYTWRGAFIPSPVSPISTASSSRKRRR
jgi:predicted AAA+ superfamily ATPase